MYISKALIVCSTFLTDSMSMDKRHDLMKTLMSGLQNHLSSSDAAIRHIGEMLLIRTILLFDLKPSLHVVVEAADELTGF